LVDLKNAGIETQLIVANMMLPEDVCTNDFFKSRRRMQLKYLDDIRERFRLPILQFPMMEEDIEGLKQIKQAILNLY